MPHQRPYLTLIQRLPVNGSAPSVRIDGDTLLRAMDISNPEALRCHDATAIYADGFRRLDQWCAEHIGPIEIGWHLPRFQLDFDHFFTVMFASEADRLVFQLRWL